MVVPSSELWWKNKSPRSPSMNPNPLSAITFLIVPCGMMPLLQKKVKNALSPPCLHPEPLLVKEECGRTVGVRNQPQLEIGTFTKKGCRDADRRVTRTRAL